jgi:hypothetical protein
VLKQVVTPFSGAAYFGDAFKVPLSDHFSIAKPSDAQALQHRMLCDFIESIVLQKDNASNVWECTGGFQASVGASEIKIVAGRIEEFPVGPKAVVALPCNEYFDDHCNSDPRSALGVYQQALRRNGIGLFGSSQAAVPDTVRGGETAAKDCG